MPISAVNLRWLTDSHDLHRMFASEEKSHVISYESEVFTHITNMDSGNITIKFQIFSSPQSSLTAARRMGLGEDRPHPEKSGGLNGSLQHWFAVYWPESQNTKSFVVVDLIAVPPRRALLENTLTSLFS